MSKKKNSSQRNKNNFEVPEDMNKHKKEIEIKPKNEAQAHYLMNLESKDITISTGPAGTGKSYVVLAYAAKLLEHKKIEKIVVTRPIIEAGGGIGYLPGDLSEKIDPYFQAPKDILVEILGESYVQYLMKVGKIEFRPLEFLRGSTFKKSFMILDEAQNTTTSQMLLFLSRIGGDSKIVLNGDTAQSDLNEQILDGLTDARQKLQNLPEVGIVDFEEDDIVRSKLAKKIIQSYRNT